MASAYSITTYRDPEKVDLSSTFKAQSYKQQNYDQNVTQVQQLVNQYAGTDLLRDVDKEYFAERLGTIVKYVNESGTSDWSRKSVANEIQNYVSGAIDQNVVTAIGSTRAYRSQMAKIEAVKEKNPELWSLQNQEFATSDLNRYLSSEKVGDSYKARDYVNYKDVQKHILDNSKTLKEFGVEYHFDPIGGNAYFTRMGKSERISNESAREYLNMIMTPEMQNQLSIDGWYTYRSTNDDEIVEKYQGKLNANLDYASDRKAELKLALVSAPKSKKAEIQANIDKLDVYQSSINDKKNNPKIGRDGMINDLYVNDFYDKNTSFLSYDRVIDTFVDDSGFKIAEFTQKVNNDNFRNQMDATKFNYEVGRDQIKDSIEQQKLDIEYKKIGYKKNSDGTYSEDPNSSFGPNGSIPITDIPGNPDEKDIPDGFIALDREHTENATIVNQNVVQEVNKIFSDPKNEKLAQELGVKPGQTAQAYTWMMINSPDRAKVLYNLLSDESKTMIDKTRGTTSALKSVDNHYNVVRNNAQTFIKGIESSPKENSKKLFDIANNNQIIDESGKVVKGAIAGSNRKDGFAATTKMIGYYNSVLSSENLTESDKAKYHRLILNEIRNTPGKNGKKIDANTAAGIFDKMVYRENVTGFGDRMVKLAATSPLLGDMAELVVRGAQGVANVVSDTNDFTFGKDFSKYRQEATYGKNNTRGIMNDSLSFNGIATANEDIASIGNSDIKLPNGMTPGKILDDNKQQLEAISKKLNNYTYDVNKAVNLYTGDKKVQSMLPHLMSVLPIGTNIEKDSNVQMVIDQKTGLATITASVKDGKEYETQTFEGIKMAELPPQILQNMKVENDNKIYSAANPYAVKYSDDIEIPQTQADFAKKIEFLPEGDRYRAWQEYNSNPLATQEGIIGQMKSVYGEELINKNAEAINKIVSTPINITTEPINNKWSIVGRQDGNIVYMSPPTDEVYDRNLIAQQSEKLVTQIIQDNLKKVIKK